MRVCDMNGSEWLDDVLEEMNDDAAKGKPREKRLTVRKFIRNLGYERRGAVIVGAISNELDKRNLQTVPHFNTVWIDSTITIEPKQKNQQETADASGAKQENGDSANAVDPTIRISTLEAAGREPVSVNPNETIKCATTIMLLNDYSQLPVIQGEYHVKGVVSWESIGVMTSLGRNCEFVHQCMDTKYQEIDASAPLLEAVGIIEHNGYVLVKDNKKITGIVTASDIAQQFVQISSPFLLIGEIEGQMRRLLIRWKFTPKRLRASQNPKSAKPKPIEGPEDLTFGDYVQLLRKEENWDCLRLSGIDRKKFVERLDEVREIRNEVMHFSLDDLPPETIKKLEDFAGFFRNLVRIGLYDG